MGIGSSATAAVRWCYSIVIAASATRIFVRSWFKEEE